MNRPLLVLLGIVAITVAACRSSEDTSKEKEVTEMQKPPDPGPGIPPGYCRVIAEVVSIDDCAGIPCNGVVRISEVLGYGSAFNAPLAKGSDVRVSFTRTVKDLRVGSRFQTDLALASAQLTGSKDEKPLFMVPSYIIQ